MIFTYGEPEITYLKKKDKKLSSAIDSIGHIEREVIPDLFTALISYIVGQQISTKAWQTIWNRMIDSLGEISPDTVNSCSVEYIQRFGMTFKKAANIKAAAEKVREGTVDMKTLVYKTDEAICKELSLLDGVGIWTAEMLMIFSMQRLNVMSYGDLGIHRGLRMLYHHKKITRELFDKYKRRYSPYASVASLYLWAIAAGAIPAMRDYAPKGGE
jgi:DNA-3-methyladenine glycosylase II